MKNTRNKFPATVKSIINIGIVLNRSNEKLSILCLRLANSNMIWIQIYLNTLETYVSAQSRQWRVISSRYNILNPRDAVNRQLCAFGTMNTSSKHNLVLTFHERHFYAIRAHGMPAHIEAEHEVRVPELGAHAPNARKLLHGRKFGCHFMNDKNTEDSTEPSKNLTWYSEGSSVRK